MVNFQISIPVLLGQLMELATLGPRQATPCNTETGLQVTTINILSIWRRLLGTWGSAFTKSPQRNKQKTVGPSLLECRTCYILLLVHTFATAACFSTHGHANRHSPIWGSYCSCWPQQSLRWDRPYDITQLNPRARQNPLSLVDNETFWLQVIFEYFRSHRKDSSLIKASSRPPDQCSV